MTLMFPLKKSIKPESNLRMDISVENDVQL